MNPQVFGKEHLIYVAVSLLAVFRGFREKPTLNNFVKEKRPVGRFFVVFFVIRSPLLQCRKASFGKRNSLTSSNRASLRARAT